MSKNDFKKCVILYVEGQTEEEFYQKVKAYMRTKLPTAKFNVDKFDIVCTKSINRFKHKLLAKFQNEVMSKYRKKDEVTVVLCYDSDGYEYGTHPIVDKDKLEDELKKSGFHINEIEQIFYQNVLKFYQELL